MKELEIEKEHIEKQQSDMQASESYLACKSNLPSEYMGSRWYDPYVANERLEIRIALGNGAETIEKAIELTRKSHSQNLFDGWHIVTETHCKRSTIKSYGICKVIMKLIV